MGIEFCKTCIFLLLFVTVKMQSESINANFAITIKVHTVLHYNCRKCFVISSDESCGNGCQMLRGQMGMDTTGAVMDGGGLISHYRAGL